MTNIKLGVFSGIKNVCKSYGQMTKLSSDGEKSNKKIVFPVKQILKTEQFFLCYSSMIRKRERDFTILISNC